MSRTLFLVLSLGAAAFAAAAFLRPVPDDVEVVRGAGGLRSAEPVRLVGRAPEPLLPAGSDLASSLAVLRTEDDVRLLEHWAVRADDARVRRAAIRRLVGVRGKAARSFLLERVADASESPKVRAACAQLLGRVGTLADLEAILDGSLPRSVRAGAAAGLVELGDDARAAGRLDGVLHGHEDKLQASAVDAVVEARTSWSRRVATAYVADLGLSPASRVRLARGLGAQKVEAARPVLEELVGAEGVPPSVRVAAAEALGILGNPEARATLASVAEDAPLALRRAVAVAQQRLGRRAAERR